MPKLSVIFFLSVILSTFSATASAILITVEPDDYAAGTNLTNVSPYVTLESVTPAFPGSNVGAIYADENGALGDPDYVAPTGDLTFGNHGFFVYGEEPDLGGFSMTFHQAVSNVSLLANNEYPPGLLAIWAAFDYEGNIIGEGASGEGVALGETFAVNINLDNVWRVVVGGDASTAAINFDHLTFEVDDLVSVPGPAPLTLLLTALTVLLLRRKIA
jgi:hypothetical protein